MFNSLYLRLVWAKDFEAFKFVPDADAQLNPLAYRPYGLTDKDIRLVERGWKENVTCSACCACESITQDI